MPERIEHMKCSSGILCDYVSKMTLLSFLQSMVRRVISLPTSLLFTSSSNLECLRLVDRPLNNGMGGMAYYVLI